MASLDFVDDLTDKLCEENFNYVVVILQEGKSSFRARIFDNVVKKDAKKAMIKALKEAKLTISKRKGK